MRLLSYNIHKGIGGRDHRYRIGRIIDVIAAESPDLVCLQEVNRGVRRTRHDDQPAKIAEALGEVASLYQINVQRRKGGGYGNLLLSRWPFRKANQISLRLKRHWPRGAQLAEVDAPGGAFLLVNWHLGLGERERHWQATHLLEHPLFLESAGLPTLIAGDYNDWRNTLSRGPFARHGFRQVTAPRTRFRSFPANFPVLSLDKAFSRGPVEITGARIVHSALARDASDHLPLVVDFGLSSAP